MIEKLSQASAALVAVRVSGKLHRDDFAKLSEWIDAAGAEHGGCGLLIEFGDFHGWDAEGLADDLRFHFVGAKDVERIAYVGDKAWERVLVDLSKPITRAAIRYFDLAAIDGAYAWLAEE
jgi:hypothetical protein